MVSCWVTVRVTVGVMDWLRAMVSVRNTVR